MKDGRGHTALYWACMKGHTDTTRLLVEHNAVVDMKNGNGCTVLDYARRCGHTDIVRLLEQHRANRS